MEYCSSNGAYAGHPCRALRSQRLEEKDDQDMLNSIASYIALGQGVEDQSAYDSISSFRNFDMPWRLAL